MNQFVQNISNQDQAIRYFLHNYLDKPKNDQTIQSILAYIGEYYQADRAYIFEVTDGRLYANNLYEWCDDGITAEIENLQNIPLEGLECWFEEFEEKGEFFISSLSEDYHPASKTYQILEPQGIESLAAAPMVVNDTIVGFLGVDNPRRNTGDLLLLSVVASTCYSEISTRRQMDSKLKQSSQAIQKMKVKELETQDNLIQALAIPYENIYAVNADTCEAVCYRMGQTMSERYGQKFAAGNYEKNICDYIENDVLEEDRHLFAKLRFVSGVNELLADRKTYYFNYRVLRNNRMQYFQCQIVKPNRERNEFVVGFKNVDEEKQQELAQQRKVEEALTVVEQLNTVLQEEMVEEDVIYSAHCYLMADAAAYFPEQERYLPEGAMDGQAFTEWGPLTDTKIVEDAESFCEEKHQTVWLLELYKDEAEAEEEQNVKIFEENGYNVLDKGEQTIGWGDGYTDSLIVHVYFCELK